jgi:hypothetical protein
VNVKKSKPSLKPDTGNADTLPMDEEDHDVKRTGRVKFDDRGNAVWEWAMATGAFGGDVSTTRLRTLDHPSLSIAEDAPPPEKTVRANPLGAKKGYDPYDSGKLDKAQAARKKDLRRLSEWLKLKKQAAENKKHQDDLEEE